MRAGTRKESIESRGGTARNDWFNPVDGGGLGNGSFPETEGIGTGAGGAGRGGEDALGQASGFDALSDCPGGVCPVPWAKAAEILSESKFLSSDRNSNFPGENTIEEPPVIQEDTVNHPSHYTDGGGIECIEAIEAQLTSEEYLGYLRGNCVKYLWRWRQKGGKTDIDKCLWYLKRLQETLES